MKKTLISPSGAWQWTKYNSYASASKSVYSYIYFWKTLIICAKHILFFTMLVLFKMLGQKSSKWRRFRFFFYICRDFQFFARFRSMKPCAKISAASWMMAPWNLAQRFTSITQIFIPRYEPAVVICSEFWNLLQRLSLLFEWNLVLRLSRSLNGIFNGDSPALWMESGAEILSALWMESGAETLSLFAWNLVRRLSPLFEWNLLQRLSLLLEYNRVENNSTHEKWRRYSLCAMKPAAVIRSESWNLLQRLSPLLVWTW
jgi:hypothetical protein